MRIPKEIVRLAKLAAESTPAMQKAAQTAAEPAAASLPQPSLQARFGNGASRRSLFTMVDKDKLPGDAALVGYHGTSTANMQKIKQEGFDSTLAGKSSGKSMGPGLYGSNSPEVAAFFGGRASHMNVATSNPDDRSMEMMSVHVVPNPELVVKSLENNGPRNANVKAALGTELLPHHIEVKRTEDSNEFVITPKGLDDPAVQYFGVHRPEMNDQFPELVPARGPFGGPKKS